MTVKELLKALQGLPDNMDVWWEDTIEGNDCPANSVYLEDERLFISPLADPRVGGVIDRKSLNESDILYRDRKIDDN